MLRDVARTVLTSPGEVCTRLWGKFRERSEHTAPRCDYDVRSDWESVLHQAIGVPFPCALPNDLEEIWSSIREKLHARGIDLGPASYSGYNDGDLAFIRAIWCLVRHLRAGKVVETGVAHGVTSRFVLEAFRRQGFGQLWSIDLPPTTVPDIHDQIGTVVSADLAASWTYIRGSSRRRLRPLLQSTGQIDLFIHDSWHSEYNILFELQTAWPRIKPGGAMVVDDIDLNWAFYKFAQSIPGHLSMVCAAETVRPDPLRLRLNQKGLFGIILKNNIEGSD
jgi:predicted O-methyltransferase YrrM